MKSCTACGVEKPLDEYHRRADTRDGHSNRCKSCKKAYAAAHYRANADRIKAERKVYYESNREAVADRNRAWYEANREYVAEQQRGYRAENAERIRERARAYHADRWARDPEYRAAYRARYNRRRRLLAGAIQEPYTTDAIADRDGWVCHLCEDPVDPSTRWPDSGSASVDHVIPLSLGGDDTPSNVRLAHLGCNVSRGARVA